jgi:hypothetical protein
VERGGVSVLVEAVPARDGVVLAVWAEPAAQRRRFRARLGRDAATGELLDGAIRDLAEKLTGAELHHEPKRVTVLLAGESATAVEHAVDLVARFAGAPPAA